MVGGAGDAESPRPNFVISPRRKGIPILATALSQTGKAARLSPANRNGSGCQLTKGKLAGVS